MPRFERRDTSNLSDAAYQDYILQGVSRTFALTIPQLPAALRQVVGNAYLLCRIADTIEDDPYLSPADKRVFSERFIAVVNGREESEAFAVALSSVLAEETPDAEKDLVDNTGRAIRITQGLSLTQQAALARCIAIMAEGMAYYQEHTPSAGLDDMHGLNSYCYHVAGVVGEMLTDIFCEYCEEVQSRREELVPLAVSFGQGLQMTNILKDIWDDYLRGVCWLPRTVFDQQGVDLSDLNATHNPEAFAAGLDELIGIAHAHLRNALDYTLAIPAREKGMRRFCLWAIGMAVLSLRKIHRNPHFSSGREVKISRRAVSAVVALSNLSVGSDALVRTLFNLAATGLPKPVYSNISVADIRIEGYLSVER